jgi:hypothetical protein
VSYRTRARQSLRAIANTPWSRVLQSAATNGDRPVHAFQLEQQSHTSTTTTAAASAAPTTTADASSTTSRPARSSRQRTAISYAEHLSDTASEGSDNDNDSPSAAATAAAASSNNNSVTSRNGELTSHALHAEAARKRAANAIAKRSSSSNGHSSTIIAGSATTVMQPTYKRPRIRNTQTASSSGNAAAGSSVSSAPVSTNTPVQQYQQPLRLNRIQSNEFIQSIVSAASRGTSSVIALLPKVSHVLAYADAATQAELLTAGMLTAIKQVLALALPSDAKCAILRLLLPLPVKKEQIKQSGLGKLLVEEASQTSNSSDEVKTLVRRVLLNWR